MKYNCNIRARMRSGLRITVPKLRRLRIGLKTRLSHTLLKVQVTLETAGTRIAEIRTDRMFQDAFGEFSWRTAEAALVRTLECEVISQARALIRAHVLKL
jgi:hypothetical protein